MNAPALISAPATNAQTVRFLESEMTLGGDLGELRDSSPLRDDAAAMRQRLDEDGYLLIRGLHDRSQVQAAHREMIAPLVAAGAVASDGRIIPEGWKKGLGQGVGRGEAFRQVVEGPRVMGFFDHLLGQRAMTFDFKWTRAVGNGDATGVHIDIVYMGRGTPNLYTCWSPYADYAPANGVLAVLPGAHRAPGWQPVRDTYGRMDVDRDRVKGWFSGNPAKVAATYGGRWATTSFRAGDALIFGMWTPHASTTNVTDLVRITSDTRYQRANDPVDERWVARAGKEPIGHYAWHTGTPKSMEDAKREWGLVDA